MKKPSAIYEPPWMYPQQRAAVWDPARISVVEASTKSGKTTACLVWLLEQALGRKSGQSVWWVAPVFSQARIAYDRFRAGVDRRLYLANATTMTVVLANGAQVAFKSGDNPDSLYGDDVYAAVIDEATRVKEEAWHAVRSTLTATRGPVRIIGNVKGRKNWAYQIARRAEAGEPDMAWHRITAHDAVAAGVLAAAEIEAAGRDLPERVFRELYLAEPSDDEGNPFGLDAIRSCVGAMSTRAPHAWGWDLAKSVDWTVGVALDESGAVCRLERWQGPWQETMRRIREATGDTQALVDSTGVGDPVLEQLQSQGGAGQYEGLKFSSTSKQQIMEGLAVALQQREIRIPPGVLVQELESFEYQYTTTGVRYSAPPGCHDDAVCALALALAKWRRSPAVWAVGSMTGASYWRAVG